MIVPQNNKDFYEFLSGKKVLIEFLKNILTKEQNYVCSRVECQQKPKNFELEFLKNRLIFRCQSLGCRQYFSARNEVFSLQSTSNLSIHKVLEIYWYWSFKQPVNYTFNQCNLAEKTIINWYKKIRNILYDSMLDAPEMGGPGYRIQIDESLFQGKRKSNRGRLLSSDKGSKKSFRSKNYGDRVQGPWVFGLVCQKIEDIQKVKAIKSQNHGKIKTYLRTFRKEARASSSNDKRKINTRFNRVYGQKRSYKSKLTTNFETIPKEVRMFVVERRDAETLIPIIKRNCKVGSEIVSDEWRSYSQLKIHGYKHFKVNHTKNFVNPTTGKHTQLIECLWNVAKQKIMRQSRGTSHENLPSHLAEQWFRSISPNSGHLVFKKILEFVRDYYINLQLKNYEQQALEQITSSIKTN
ncbi:unnamed protein product, partial [Brachionus calyciflorus]